MTGKKLERPLFLDMPFEEALARYAQAKPEEVEPPPGRKKKAARPKPDDRSVDPKPDRKRQPG